MDTIKEYKNGEELRDSLQSLPIGEYIIFSGVLHKVIDCSDKGQGNHVACVRTTAKQEIGLK